MTITIKLDTQAAADRLEAGFARTANFIVAENGDSGNGEFQLKINAPDDTIVREFSQRIRASFEGITAILVG